MRQAQGNGYRVHLWFVGTRSAEVNLDRVRRRFFKGGHDVPKKDIVKRYEGGCERLKGYIELADEARIYDNSIENAPEPRLVAADAQVALGPVVVEDRDRLEGGDILAGCMEKIKRK